MEYPAAGRQKSAPRRDLPYGSRNWRVVSVGLAGLHAAAVLVHHFILRDEVLGTMAPAFRRAQALLTLALAKSQRLR